jgi:hypothetical protein
MRKSRVKMKEFVYTRTPFPRFPVSRYPFPRYPVNILLFFSPSPVVFPLVTPNYAKEQGADALWMRSRDVSEGDLHEEQKEM